MTTLSIEANLDPLTHQQGLKMDSDKFSQLISHIKRLSSDQMSQLKREIARHEQQKKPLLSEEEREAIQSLFSNKH
ncbi:hypothetical protein GT360_16530 [Vibrio astriarenae]|uniref:Uncharacterized protein n=1 Tax=Vibrio astriarenae TaxID=1481923 RepID=A0A7Z2YF61_9VIBR|nr:hypothetical protein [Vibrio astriarenae]QIA65162.1 hypothetical protein GT360_16530 [Vibrio astriarenae]